VCRIEGIGPALRGGATQRGRINRFSPGASDATARGPGIGASRRSLSLEHAGGPSLCGAWPAWRGSTAAAKRFSNGVLMLERKLNVGCGADIRAGYVNLDTAELPGVDVIHDLSDLPLPFEAEEFDEVLCLNILEHVDLVPVMAELHRVLAPGGRLIVSCPHFTSRAAFLDPTHRKAFSVGTFWFFVRGGRHAERDYYFPFAFDRMESSIRFRRHPLLPWNYLLDWMINVSPYFQAYFEETGLSRMFPAMNVEAVLQK
jgi:SAM-dependent methyltransferase